MASSASRTTPGRCSRAASCAPRCASTGTVMRMLPSLATVVLTAANETGTSSLSLLIVVLVVVGPIVAVVAVGFLVLLGATVVVTVVTAAAGAASTFAF